MNVNELIDILNTEKPSEELLKREEELFLLIPELAKCKGFNQNNSWHQYDVYEHILHVIDNTPQNVALRLAALFHDVGKPETYTEDENGVGHFYNHWAVSEKIFSQFAKKHGLSLEAIKFISNLILYHDLNIGKLSNDELNILVSRLNKNEIIALYQLKKADLLAQNETNHYLLSDYQKQQLKLLVRYNRSKQ